MLFFVFCCLLCCITGHGSISGFAVQQPLPRCRPGVDGHGMVGQVLTHNGRAMALSLNISPPREDPSHLTTGCYSCHVINVFLCPLPLSPAPPPCPKSSPSKVGLHVVVVVVPVAVLGRPCLWSWSSLSLVCGGCHGRGLCRPGRCRRCRPCRCPCRCRLLLCRLGVVLRIGAKSLQLGLPRPVESDCRGLVLGATLTKHSRGLGAGGNWLRPPLRTLDVRAELN